MTAGAFGKTRLITIGVAMVAGAFLVARLIKAAKDPAAAKAQTWAYKAADALGFV